ncbi:MAG: J domain-containing protein [Gemmatimonadetes bacterium]|nr:J domain-containing protein [Gemmatimonadota bacterium]
MKPRRSVASCYRVLGLPPGTALADIKKAYLDLAQVWHPDRFVHDPRLQQKAQDNLKRINEAYEILQSSDLPDRPTRISRISSSFHAILGIGDMLKTGTHRSPRPKRQRVRVLLPDEDDTRLGRRPSHDRLWLALGGIVVLGIVLALLLI